MRRREPRRTLARIASLAGSCRGSRWACNTGSSWKRGAMSRLGATGSSFKLGLAALVFAASLPVAAHSCFWSQIGDHQVSYDASGVWNPNSYRGMIIGLTIAQVGGALWEGSETRFGKTMWQGIDSEIISG